MDYEKVDIPTVSDLNDIAKTGRYMFNGSIVTQELLSFDEYSPPLNIHDPEGNRVGQIFTRSNGQIWCRQPKCGDSFEWEPWICWIGQGGYAKDINGAHKYLMDASADCVWDIGGNYER